MANIEGYNEAINDFGITTAKAIVTTSTLAAGATSITGTLGATGVLSVSSGSTTTGGGAIAINIGSGPFSSIYFGSGAPTVTAPTGSLYLRSDGSSTNNRIYVNTSGSSTWAYITTSA